VGKTVGQASWAVAGRHRLVARIALAAALACALVVSVTPAAVAVESATEAAEAPTATPPPTPLNPAPPASHSTATPPASPAPKAPTITGPPNGTFIGLGATTVAGTRESDQTIQLLSPVPGHDPFCIIAPDGSTEWSCTAGPLPSGRAVVLRAVVSGAPDLDASITVPVLTPPTVTGGASGQKISDGRLRGTGYPGASVTASLAAGGSCTGTADASGAWACTLPGVTDRDGQVTARQQSDDVGPGSSNNSAPVSIRFDVTPPSAPTVATPANGSRVPLGATTYSGTGENGATVTVFAGPYSVCGATVSGGRWSCAGSGVAAGSYNVIALQQDAAGNASPGSDPITVAYGPAPSLTPSPSQPPDPASTPSPGAQGSTPSPSGGQSPAAEPAPPAAPPSASAEQPSPAPPTIGGTGSVRPLDRGGWSAPTRFTTAVLPPGEAGAFPWLQALILALGALLLFAIPVRLLAGTISRARDGRALWHPGQLAGRNHAGVEFETAPEFRVNRTLVASAALVAAAALVILSGPVTDLPVYLRLLLAVVIALGVVNAVATLAPWWWSTRVLGVAASVSFLPRYLLLVAVTALGSRLFDVHPAFLFGLLGSVAMATAPTIAVRGQLAAVRAASLLVLALLGWMVLGAVPAAGGFGAALAAEIANTIILVAVGSAVLVLIPIGRTSGRSVLAWSPPAWAALTVLAFAMLFVVLSPSVEELRHGTGTLLWVAAGAFAALSVGAWAWQRFVVPALR
jgi:hypothetical protein